MGWDANFEILTGPISAHDLAIAAHYPNEPNNTNWLIANGIFNKWAKHKGFDYNIKGFPYDKTQATPELRQPAYATALISKNCGLAMRRYAGSNAGDDAWAAGIALADGGSDWIWVRPSGGASSPYRVMDFDGYSAVAGAPFQYGPYPNPAYQNSTVVVNDSGATGIADISMADLNGDDTMVSQTHGYLNIRSYVPFCMLGKRTDPDDPSTAPAVPSLIYRLSSQIQNLRLSNGVWDCVTIFVDPTTAANISDGTYQSFGISGSGGVVLAPVGRKSFRYYDKYPMSDAGSSYNLRSVFIQLNILQTINYTASLGIQFRQTPMGAWSTTQYIETTGGSLAGGSIYTKRVTAPYDDPAQFRLVFDGIADHGTYSPAYSPTP